MLEYWCGLARKHYRCLEPILPTSKVVVFEKDKYDNLELKTIEKVINVKNPSSASGDSKVYNQAGEGDSGSAVSAKVDVPNNFPKTVTSIDEKRHVILAIISSGGGIEKAFAGKNKCNNVATKVSEDVVSWIKKIELTDSNSGKQNKFYHKYLKPCI